MKNLTFLTLLFMSFNSFTQDIAGTFSLKGSNINYFTGIRAAGSNSSTDTNPKISITIDSVKIYIVEGTIRKIYVHSTRKILVDSTNLRFSNMDIPIPVTRFSERKWDILEENENDQEYIYVGDLLSYKEDGEDSVIPDDVTFVLKPGNGTNKKELIKSSLLAIDLRAYSDLLGVFDEQSNGLVQTEGSLKILTHTQNTIKNKPIYFAQYIQPYFNLSRFDSIYRQTNIGGDSIINRMSVLQRSPFTFGVRLNAIKLYLKSGHNFELNLGYQYNKSYLYRTSDSTKLACSLNSFYFQIPIRIKLGKTIGFNYIPSFYLQDFESSKAVNFIKNLSNNTVIQNEFLLYFSVAKNDKNNKVFIRFNLFLNPTEKGNNYNQLQIGYERSLSDLLNKLPF